MGLLQKQVGAFKPKAIQGFDPEQLLNLDASAFGGFSKKQVGAFKPKAIQGFDPEQLLNLDASAFGLLQKTSWRLQTKNVLYLYKFNP